MRRLALVLFAGVAGCECGDGRVAELVSRERDVDRSAAAAPERWTAAQVGDGFALGDAVRTGDRSRARVRLDDGSGLELTPRTIVRFLAAAPGRGGSRVGIDAGEVVLEAEGGALSVVTGIGDAWIERGGVARLRSDGPRGARLEVSLGSARFESEGGRAVALSAGQHVVLGVGGAVIEEEPAGEVPAPTPVAAAPPAPGAVAAPPEPDGGAPGDGEQADGEAEATGPVPATVQAGVPADVAIAAGESPTIHDSGGPTAVRIRFGALCPEAVVRAGGRRVPPVRGRGAAVFSLGAGAHRYTVTCLTADGRLEATPRSSGTILVRRDSGATPLAGRIPHNTVDADGRRYTVLYQNRLPSLTFRWSDDTATGPFVLHVQSEGGGGRTVNAPGPRATLASGELTEGRYRFWFTAGGGRRSADTSLRVGFDNAAPTAWLRDVAAAGAGGSSVRIAGAVLDGWTATVGDRPLALDENNRFEADLTPFGDERAVAIRIARPGRGVHYYLRRPAGGRP